MSPKQFKRKPEAIACSMFPADTAHPSSTKNIAVCVPGRERFIRMQRHQSC